MDIVCLLFWCFQLVYGIDKLLKKEEVEPLIFICAVVVCVAHCFDKII